MDSVKLSNLKIKLVPLLQGTSRDRALARERFIESAGTQSGLIYKINFFCGHTKKLDTESKN